MQTNLSEHGADSDTSPTRKPLATPVEEKITLTIESTNIRNNSQRLMTYFYKV